MRNSAKKYPDYTTKNTLIHFIPDLTSKLRLFRYIARRLYKKNIEKVIKNRLLAELLLLHLMNA